MTQNKIIAVTGGIGSGKSTVCNIIKSLGYSVYSCDEIYRELLEQGKLLSEIVAAFGKEIIVDGKLNRGLLAQKIFADGAQLLKLNSITHPAIYNEAFKKLQGDKVGFLEVPLLFESGYENKFCAVIVVLRDYNERIKSVAFRDGILPVEVAKRVKSQFNYDNCNFVKYYVIHNSGNLDDLTAKVQKTVNKILGKLI